MDLRQQRDLQLLNEIGNNAIVTQRILAKKLGIALGLANLYLKRLARKGYIKTPTDPSHRVRYLLTPRGTGERSRLTELHTQYSLSHYRHIRQRLRRVLSKLAREGSRQLVIYGTGELAELAYLALQEFGLTLVGFVNGKGARTFLSCPLLTIEALPELEFDAVLIAEIEDAEKIQARIVDKGTPGNKVLLLRPLS